MTEFKGETSGTIKEFYALLKHIDQTIGDFLAPYIRWFRRILEATGELYGSNHSNKGRSAPRRRPSRKAKHTPPWEIRSHRQSINYGQAWQRCPQRHWQRESRGKWQMERDAS